MHGYIRQATNLMSEKRKKKMNEEVFHVYEQEDSTLS